MMIDAGADVNARDPKRYPLLYAAIYHNRIEIARLMVDAGANVNLRAGDRRTLFQVAEDLGRTEILDILRAASDAQ